MSKLVFFCVGTGGHVFPVKNIVLELIEKGISSERIIVFTDARGKRYLNDINVKIFTYDFFYSSSGILSYFGKIKKILISVQFVYKILKPLKISFIFTSGAYIAPIASLISIILRINMYSQEQNIEAGFGNKFASYFSKKVFTSFPDTNNLQKKKIEFVGPVINKKIESTMKIAGNSDIRIGVQGGSQGSKELIDFAIKLSRDKYLNNIHIICITGTTKDVYEDTESISFVEFYDDMSKYYSVIDLQISRAGGGALEASYLNIPQILVPYKHGTSNSHQTLNARYLEKIGLAKVLESYDEILSFINQFSKGNLDKNNNLNINNGLHRIVKELINVEH